MQNIGRKSDFKIDFHRKQAKIKLVSTLSPFPSCPNFLAFMKRLRRCLRNGFSFSGEVLLSWRSHLGCSPQLQC